jgi:large subunit ribosomal protein L7/L12
MTFHDVFVCGSSKLSHSHTLDDDRRRPMPLGPHTSASSEHHEMRMMLASHGKRLLQRSLPVKQCCCLSTAAPIKWTTDRLSTDQTEKIDRIFHKVLWLDMFETNMVTTLVNERMGILLSEKQKTSLSRQMDARSFKLSGGTGEGSLEDAVEVEEAPKLFDLKITGFDPKSKIKVIKEVRAIAGLGLKEAKEMVEGFPKVIQDSLKAERAEELKAKLEEVGAQIELVAR